MNLRPRELECLHWLALGKTSPEVAVILGLSVQTVRWYVKEARRKLDAHTIAQAVAEAAKQKLFDGLDHLVR